MNEVSRTSIILSEHDARIDAAIAWHLKTIDMLLTDHSVPDNVVAEKLLVLKEQFLVNDNLTNYVEVKSWAAGYIDMLVGNLLGDSDAA